MARCELRISVEFGGAGEAGQGLGALPHHARESYEAAPEGRRKLVALPGATHYFSGQPGHLGQACDEIASWLADEQLAES